MLHQHINPFYCLFESSFLSFFFLFFLFFSLWYIHKVEINYFIYISHCEEFSMLSVLPWCILLTIILVVVQNLVTNKNPPGQRVVMVVVISNMKFRASQLVWPSWLMDWIKCYMCSGRHRGVRENDFACLLPVPERIGNANLNSGAWHDHQRHTSSPFAIWTTCFGFDAFRNPVDAFDRYKSSRYPLRMEDDRRT